MAGIPMAQSPDRSGTFESGGDAGGPMGRKFCNAWTSIGGTGGAAACAPRDSRHRQQSQERDDG